MKPILEAPDRAGSARHSRREAVPADLLPCRLRWAWRCAKTTSRRLSSRRARSLVARRGHASQQFADRGGECWKALLIGRRQQQVRARRWTMKITALISGALRAMARAKAATSKALRSRRSCRATPRIVRPNRRHGRRVPHRRRIDRHGRSLLRTVRSVSGATACLQARGAEDCRSSSPARNSRSPRCGREGSQVSRSRGVQRARRRRRFHVRPYQGLARGRALAARARVR